MSEHKQLSMSDSTSIHKLVNYNSLNKRKNARILYPHVGSISPYPKVFFKDTELIVANISVGGLLVIDDTEAFGTAVGDMVQIDLVWSDQQTKVRAKVVGINLQRRHLQFLDFNAQAYLKITKLIRPGFLGSRFHKVKDDTGHLEAIELWVGPTGESLSFLKSGAFAELNVQNSKIVFQKNPFQISINGGAAPSLQLIEDTIVLLANLPLSSPLVKQLIELLDSQFKHNPSQKTGSHG